MKKWWKIGAFVLAALITLVALLWAEENFRAKRLWLAYQAELAAKGEVMDLAQLAPQPVPDDQNFALAPLIRPFADYVVDPKTGEARFRDTNACDQATLRFSWAGYIGIAHWYSGNMTDLATVQRDLRAITNIPLATVHEWQARPAGDPVDDLLSLLRQEQSAMDELRAALRRPASDFRMPYDSMPNLLLPRLAAMKSFGQPLRVSAVVNLAKGNVEAAFTDLTALFRLGELGVPDPLLIAGLVRIALLEIAIQPLWEGLARHQWTEAQLRTFDTLLERANPIAVMQRCLRGERIFSVRTLAHLPGEAGGTAVQEDRFSGPWRWFPAMLYQNQRHIACLFQELLLPVLNAEQGTVDLDRVKNSASRAEFTSRHPYRIFATMLLPALEKSSQTAARSQAAVNLARAAVALERYRLEKGEYPESLAPLAPRFVARLPVDPVNGQPLKYQREAADRFVLYSVGLNRQDDRGKVALNSKNAGDWVWQYHPLTNTFKVKSPGGTE